MNTKFSLLDKAYTINEDSVKKVTVFSLCLVYNPANTFGVVYSCTCDEIGKDWLGGVNTYFDVHENKLFKTKEELINSL